MSTRKPSPSAKPAPPKTEPKPVETPVEDTNPAVSGFDQEQARWL